MEGKLEGIDRYMHEREHGINNLSQKIDALALRLASDLAAVEAKMDARLKTVEIGQSAFSGAKQFGVFLVQTFLSVVAAILAVLALGKHS